MNSFSLPYDILNELSYFSLSSKEKMRVSILLNRIPPRLRLNNPEYYKEILQTAIIYAILYSNDSFIDTRNFLREIKNIYNIYNSTKIIKYEDTKREEEVLIKKEKRQEVFMQATTRKKTTIKLHPHFIQILREKFDNKRQEFVQAILNTYEIIEPPLFNLNNYDSIKSCHISVSIDLPTYFKLISYVKKFNLRSISNFLYKIQLAFLDIRKAKGGVL